MTGQVDRQVDSSVSPTERAKEIARRVLCRQYDPLLACRELASLWMDLPKVPSEIIDIFVGVASEVGDLPIGGERESWSADALITKDAEAAGYRERVRKTVEVASRNLLVALKVCTDEQ